MTREEIIKKIDERVSDNTESICDERHGSLLRLDLCCSNILLRNIREYLKNTENKKDEAEKPVVGDVVEFTGVHSDRKHIGLLYREDLSYWYIIIKNPLENAQKLRKNNWIAKKTGKHVDLEGLFK